MLEVYALFVKFCYDVIMKKLSLYIFLFLMWSNIGFAFEDLSKIDINKFKELKSLIYEYKDRKELEINQLNEQHFKLKNEISCSRY